MLQDTLHMTAMEITHSRTADEITQIVSAIQTSVHGIVNYTYNHRARLVKPMLSFDSSAIALSFVPASGEYLSDGRTLEDDNYTYSHLRRDLFSECTKAGAVIRSRYIVETSHLTIARFVSEKDFQNSEGRLEPSKVARLMSVIEEINEWLEKEYWPDNLGSVREGGQWIVGQERGLDMETGTLWYGDGNRVDIGKGF
jgi:hypothetical protein